MMPNKGKGWSERVLYSFTGGDDGSWLYGGLTVDATGAMYGTTGEGGQYDNGTVFQMILSGGKWTKTTLHSFRGYPDGGSPAETLVRGKSGQLYGTTAYGGTHACGCCGCGTVFELRKSNGQWTVGVVHDFTGRKDGRYPGSLLVDKMGDLYGGASGDTRHAGNLFELTPHSGQWGVRVPYTFTGGRDGEFPGGVILQGGKLVGPAAVGGDPNCGEGHGCGVVFEVTP
jgi:uncharacterized repeat protein (TIGR03803 family)